MRLRHKNEAAEIEEAHLQEFNAFNQNWDKKMNEFQEHGLNMLTGLENKHVRDIEDNRRDLEAKLSVVIKASPELLNMRKIQENLAKQKEYAEAHKVQARVQQLEREEEAKHLQTRQRKIAAAETKLMQKQANEV